MAKRNARYQCVAATLGAAIGLVLAGSAHAGAIPVPNGDFSAAGNAGTVGGGVLGGAGTNVGIGSSSGPWTGTFQGVAALLAPPTLTIDATNKVATISGILGISVAGILDNSGSINQTLPVPLVANKRYTVTTNVTTGQPLTLAALSSAKVGIGLLSNGTSIGDSASASAGLVNLSLLGANTYRLRLINDTGATVSGNVGISLFDQPTGLLTASLLPSASFSNVSLNVGAITDANTQLLVSGIGSLSAEVGTAFGSPLVALVTDQHGNPLEGVIVSVSAPDASINPTASAVLTGSNSTTGYSVESTTDSSGLITIAATANSIAGCYRVTASVAGVPSQAVFYLRNWSTAQATAFFNAGVDSLTALQDSIFCDGFD